MKNIFLPALFFLHIIGLSAQSALDQIKPLLDREAFEQASKLIDEALQNPKQLSHDEIAQWQFYRGLVNARIFFNKAEQSTSAITETELQSAIDGFNQSYRSGQNDLKVRSLKFLDGIYGFLSELAQEAYRKEAYPRFFYYAKWASWCHLYVCRESVTMGWAYELNSNILLLTAHGAELCGRDDEALDWYLRLIEDGTEELQVYRNASRLYESKEDVTNALGIIDYGMLKYPDSKDMLRLKLDLLMRLRRYNELIDECQKAIKRFPEDQDELRFILGKATDQAFSIHNKTSYNSSIG